MLLAYGQFCNDSEYGTKQKLEEKLRGSVSPATLDGFGSTKDAKPQPNNGLLEAHFRDRANLDRNQEMVVELERYRDERKKVKLENMNSQAQYLENLERLEKLKEEELKERFEKEQIKRSVKNLSQEQTKIIKREKEVQLERVAQEANLTKRREKELRDEIDRLGNNVAETQKIYEENARKVRAPQEMAQNISDQENLKRQMFEEKAQRVADLRARQNNLLAERNNLDRIEQEIRGGEAPDREQVAKVQERLNINAQRHLDDIKGVQDFNIDNFKRKVDSDQKRVQDMKGNDYRPQQRRDMIEEQGERRPMSKQAMAGQNALTFGRDQPEIFNSGYNTAIDVLNNQQAGNQKLQEEVDRYGQFLDNNPQPQQANQYVEGTFGGSRQTGTFGGSRQTGALGENTSQGFPQQAGQPAYPQPRQPYSAASRQQNAMRPPQPQPQQQQQYMPPNQQNGAAMVAQAPEMGLVPRRGDFDDFLTSNFVQNQMRNVDLNEDERMLVHLTMMEADSLRLLERIPPSSELYRFKLEQYKELSTQRAEVEKLVQESRLKKMKRALDMRGKEEDRRFENQRFMDDIKKQTVASKLAKDGKIPKIQQVDIKEGLRDLNPKPNVNKGGNMGASQTPAAGGEYNMNYGFVAHWDYVFGIPKNNKYCQLVYAIMNGDESLLDPQMVEARAVQDQNTQKNQCVIYENNNIREIEPNMLTNLIIEVQLPANLNNVDDYSSMGWTFINLFDVNLQLNRGKFKLPLYHPPIYRNISKDSVDQLRPVMDATILFRISYPWKDEFSNLKNLEPHLNHRDYIIPPLHIKQASTPGVLSTNLFGAQQTSPNKKASARQAQMPDSDDEIDQNDDTVGQLPQRQMPRRQDDNNEGAPSTTTRPETPHDLIARSKGVKVIIHNVHNIRLNGKAVIKAMLKTSQFVLRDDLDQDTRKHTTVHNPSGKDPEDGPGATDKRRSQNRLEFEETFTYMLNVPKRVRQDRKDVYLVLRIEVQDKDNAIGAGANTSMSRNDGLGKYQLLGWFVHKLNEPNGKVVVGTFEENFFSPPEKSPPIDAKNMVPMTSSIEFSVEELTGTTTRRKLDG